jgi:hypothetical protein
LKIQPIVEGHGEIEAVPVLLRRMRDAAALYELDVSSPIRRSRSQLVQEVELRKAIRLALLREDCCGILILFDADHDCPKTRGPQLQEWARSEAGSMPCEVIMAHHEFEAWFLGAIESLRGRRGIRNDATSHADPESPQDAKGHLEDRLLAGRSYSPTVDQAALTALFDMGAAYRRCRSFRRMVKAFGITAGASAASWPPPAWLTPA